MASLMLSSKLTAIWARHKTPRPTRQCCSLCRFDLGRSISGELAESLDTNASMWVRSAKDISKI